MKRIVNIIIFAVAILVGVLAVAFVMVYNDDFAGYKQATLINETEPAMLDDLLAATPEQLPAFVAKYQEKANALSAELKAQEMPNDILYTYIYDLDNLTEETFPEFKAGFQAYAARQFAKTDKKQEYVDGFAKVNDFAAVNPYVSGLKDDYRVVRQEYLQKKDFAQAVNSMLGKAIVITETVTASKQETQLAELKDAVESAKTSATLLNVTVILCYVLFIVAIVMMLAFGLYQMGKNIKTSYKALLAVAVMIVFFIGAYFGASGELTESAIKAGLGVSAVKLISAGVITFYVIFFLALLSVIGTWVMNIIKSR